MVPISTPSALVTSLLPTNVNDSCIPFLMFTPSNWRWNASRAAPWRALVIGGARRLFRASMKFLRLTRPEVITRTRDFSTPVALASSVGRKEGEESESGMFSGQCRIIACVESQQDPPER